MPELPEVETVRRGLAPALVGRRLARVETRRADLRFPFPEGFAERLQGARVLDLTRRAKYLLAPLDTGETLAAHLGMSGRFTLLSGGDALDPGAYYHTVPPNPAHTHVVLETDRGARVEYNDPRRFGYMTLIASEALEAHPFFKGLGPEPLSNAFNAAHLVEAFAGRSQNVKATLLDQRTVAGLGNIYVCEALFRSGIAPTKEAGRVSHKAAERLAVAVRDVLNEAIEVGGSSLRDYRQANGSSGAFQERFRVYDREGGACVSCAKPVQRIVQSGRSTFFCKTCQR